MLRNWCKHWKRIGAKIWKTPEFHNVWQILRGCPYIPWTDDLVDSLFGYLRAQCCDSNRMNEKYHIFLDYLLKEYFTAEKNGKVNVLGYLNWQHSDFILKNGGGRFNNKHGRINKFCNENQNCKSTTNYYKIVHGHQSISTSYDEREKGLGENKK